jgi:hypothetical protein
MLTLGPALLAPAYDVAPGERRFGDVQAQGLRFDSASNLEIVKNARMISTR